LPPEEFRQAVALATTVEKPGAARRAFFLAGRAGNSLENSDILLARAFLVALPAPELAWIVIVGVRLQEWPMSAAAAATAAP
jgi:hypothetical protein